MKNIYSSKREHGLPNAALLKLAEECAELIQIAMKQAHFIDSDEHPDGNGSMQLRIEEEMGDVLAAISLVAFNRQLDWEYILQRMESKIQLLLSFQHGGKPDDFDSNIWVHFMPFMQLQTPDSPLSQEQVQNIVQMRLGLSTASPVLPEEDQTIHPPTDSA